MKKKPKSLTVTGVLNVLPKGPRTLVKKLLEQIGHEATAQRDKIRRLHVHRMEAEHSELVRCQAGLELVRTYEAPESENPRLTVDHLQDVAARALTGDQPTGPSAQKE